MADPFVDTDVLIRLLTGDDRAKQAEATALFQRVEAGTVQLVAPANEPYFVGEDITRYKVLHRIYSDHLATQQALHWARLTIRDIDVIELHDAFIPQFMITLAEMGVVRLGHANDLVEEGIIMPGGRLLVNPSGGLVFGGHFVGGSNMMSTWSVMRELRERDLTHGMVHGTGSSLSMYGVAMVLERRA